MADGSTGVVPPLGVDGWAGVAGLAGLVEDVKAGVLPVAGVECDPERVTASEMTATARAAPRAAIRRTGPGRAAARLAGVLVAGALLAGVLLAGGFVVWGVKLGAHLGLPCWAS